MVIEKLCRGSELERMGRSSCLGSPTFFLLIGFKCEICYKRDAAFEVHMDEGAKTPRYFQEEFRLDSSEATCQ